MNTFIVTLKTGERKVLVGINLNFALATQNIKPQDVKPGSVKTC